MNMCRMSGHFVECIQHCDEKKNIGSTFDSLWDETKIRILSDKSIDEQKTAIDHINRIGTGIRLNQCDYKLLLSIYILLNEKSETEDYDSNEYYAGNAGIKKVTIQTPNGDLQLVEPKIKTTIREITKVYYGTNNIGGRNIKKVIQLLFDLSNLPEKKVMLQYVSQEPGDKAYLIESYRNLISFDEPNDGGELTISLHPIFIHSIAGKYVEIPTDIISRITDVNGHANISIVMQKFLFELFHALSNWNYKKNENGNRIYTIGEDKLLAKIADKYRDKKTGKITRLKLVKSILHNSITLAKNLGLILNHDFVAAKKGYKYCFILPDNTE
jgi:hypothetical protein